MNSAALRLPESVLQSAEFVMLRASHVEIDEAALSELRPLIEAKLEEGAKSVEDAFGTTGSLDGDINLIFFETAANFCFWAQDENEKWEIECDGAKISGWYGFAKAFYRAVQNGIPLHDAEFMETLKLKQAAEIFAGHGGRPIPLLELRVNNIIEVARFLNANYSGSGKQFLAQYNYSAPEIAQAAANNLPSFRDGAQFENEWVWFLKRAQILPSDLSQLGAKYPEFHISDTDKLTIFADYRLPQILRHYDVLRYSQDLARRVDSRQTLPAQSPEEVEIRAATVAACEKLKNICGGLTSAEVDLALWLLSQDMRDDPKLQPHHRTISGYY